MPDFADYYRDTEVRLTDLVGPDGRLQGVSFVDCKILGPAVVILDQSTLSGCQLGGPSVDAVLWPIEAERNVVVGAVYIRECSFKGCNFYNVGIAGPRDFIQSLSR